MDSKKILLIQTAFLGDLLLSIPLIRRIHKKFPSHSISVVCRKGVGQPLKDLKLVNEIFEIQKGSGETYKALSQKLENTQFDYIFCPHDSVRSALFAKTLKANHKIAFKKWWNLTLFSHLVSKNKKHPEALRQMSLLLPFDSELAGYLNNYTQKFLLEKTNRRKLDAVPEWAATECLEQIPGSKHSPQNQYACIFPGSVWNTKKWTESGFAEVAQWLSDQKYQIVFMGGADEKVVCENISRKIPGSLNYAGKTNLTESLALLKSAALCVSNDSAGQHLASVAGTPTVSIFGPTVLEQGYRPWNSNSVTVELRSLECRPCGKHGHQVCPIKTHQCMKGIASNEVIEAIKSLLPQSALV